MGRGKKAHIKEILSDISGLDPGPIKNRPEIRKIVEKMIEQRPDVSLSSEFKAKLRSRIFKEEKKENRIIKFFSPRRMMLAASIFSALLVIVFLPALLLNEKNKSPAEGKITLNSIQKFESSARSSEQPAAGFSDEPADILSDGKPPAPEPSLDADRTDSGLQQESLDFSGTETGSQDLRGRKEESAASYSSLPIEKKDPSETQLSETVEADKLLANNEFYTESAGSAEQEAAISSTSDTRHFETVEDEEYKLMDSFVLSEAAAQNDETETIEGLVTGSDDDTISKNSAEITLGAVSAAVMKEKGMESDAFSFIREYLERGELPPVQILDTYSLFSLFQDLITAEKLDNISGDFYSVAAVSPYDPETAWLLVYTDFPEIEKSRIEISFNRDIVYTVRTAADPDIDVLLSSDRFSLLINEEGNGRHFIVTRLKLVKKYMDIAGINDTASVKLTVFSTDRLKRDSCEVHNIIISSSMNELMAAAVPFYMWFESVRTPESADLQDFLELKKILAEYPDQSEEGIEKFSGLLDLTIDIFEKTE